MKSAAYNNIILDSYIGLLNHLSLTSKLDLISKLKELTKTDIKTNNSKFKDSFGAFESDKSAEEIIEDIKKSRVFNRQIELF
jgi:hypothetical protein